MEEARTPSDHHQLLTQAAAFRQPQAWRVAAAHEVGQRLTDTTFPCIFSRNAFKKELVRFIFVEDCSPQHLQDLGAALAGYVELSRNWDGRLDTAYPLVILFSLRACGNQSITEYHQFGWRMLQGLHAVDPAPQPAGVPPDPSDPVWSMCFAGMPLFVNMSTPAHTRRHSRNLGQHFAFVINPRERFDIVAGPTPRGRRVRANIRRRLDAYDEISHSPDLGTYGTGALEWHQYEILDDNDSAHAPRCPFRSGTA